MPKITKDSKNIYKQYSEYASGPEYVKILNMTEF